MSEKGTRPSAARRARMLKSRPVWAPSVETAEREIRRARKARYRRHRQNVLLAVLAIALALGYAAHSFCFELVQVRGTGMNPTLESGSMVLCVKQSLLDKLAGIVPEDYRRIGRNDLLLISYAVAPDGETTRRVRTGLLIKRAVAMGGDEIDTAGGEIIINRDELAGKLYESDLVYPVTVPTGRIFALGDNRALSVDSRQRSFGMVAEADVLARPLAVVWPVYAMGLLK